MRIIGEAYEVGRRELVEDARLAWTWDGPADDLVTRLSDAHDWPSELTVGYLAALQRVRVWNLPDRGW